VMSNVKGIHVRKLRRMSLSLTCNGFIQALLHSRSKTLLQSWSRSRCGIGTSFSASNSLLYRQSLSRCRTGVA
jgi:hypothetical protein